MHFFPDKSKLDSTLSLDNDTSKGGAEQRLTRLNVQSLVGQRRF